MQEPEHHEDHRGGDADLLVGRDEPHEHRRAPHHGQRDEKGVLATDQVADAAEDDRPEGADGEPRPEGREGRQQRRRGMAGGENSVEKKTARLPYR